VTSSTVEIGGRSLTLSNLDKVLYPDGFTKGQVIDYYVRIAPVLLPHLQGRACTMVRWPDGVQSGKHFYNKNLPSHTPDWVPRVEQGGVTYGVVDDLATLVWMANLAALELHVPLHRAAAGSSEPDHLVFDLDPGPGAGTTECCAVALEIHELLAPLGFAMVAKTSGSKGVQLYARPSAPLSYGGEGGTTMLAKRVAEGLEQRLPDRVVSKQDKTLRPGKVLIDWSQNVSAKTTVAVYSLRARDTPTVSTPLRWDEVQQGAQGAPLVFTAPTVLGRVEQHGDLFALPGLVP
jgi:bifunctional non-homologous end joining protein LigD